MRKTLATIAIFAVLLFFTSSYGTDDTGIRIGEFAPNFSVGSKGENAMLSAARGKYVLLNFWASGDAASRIRNVEYDRFCKSGDSDLIFMSINFDDSKRLYSEVVRVDKLDSKTQSHNEDGPKSGIYGLYHLKNGFSGYLLDKEGKIVAINPTKQQLTDILCQ